MFETSEIKDVAVKRESLWNVEEAAAYLNVAPSWVREHASGRRHPALPCKRLGARCIRFVPGEVRAFLEGLAR
ncbi:MAG: DNA-binding protein [Bryobacteraceae bacterium]